MGAGRVLCRAVIEWCQSLNAGHILLEVRASNIAAIGLYGSLGFVKESRRKRYYQDPEEDAVMMCFDLRQCE
jgi:ribosomal-protein-alanine N-acetyltransferase